MNRRHTKESINNELKETNRQLVLLDEYINPKTYINFKCLVCGYIWNTTQDNVFNKNCNCPCCNNRLPKTKESINNELKETNRHLVLLDEYVNPKTKINFECLICGYIWPALADNILNKGTGCRKCGGTCPKTKEEVNEILILRNIELIGPYKNGKSKATFKCLICNHIWTVVAGNVIHKTNCPKCGKSGGFDFNAFAILYYVKINHNNELFWKIGITNKTLKKRFKKRDFEKIEKIFVVEYDIGRDAYNKEQEILKRFSEYKYIGEPLLKYGGDSEIFIKDIFDGDYTILMTLNIHL